MKQLLCYLGFSGISEIWYPRHETLGGRGDPRPVTHLISRTRYPIPGTLKLGFEIRDPKPETLMISETRDPRPGTLKVGPAAHMINETRSTQLFSNLGPKNYDPNDP